jgi:hypothetical protein
MISIGLSLLILLISVKDALAIYLCPGECQGVNFLTNCNIQTNGTCTLATGYTYCYSELIPIGLYIGQCCPGQWSEVQCVVMENLTVTTTTKYGPADGCYPVPITGVNACNQTDPCCKCRYDDATAHDDLGGGSFCLEGTCAGQG